MRGLNAKLHHPDLGRLDRPGSTPGPWLVRSKSQLAGFSLIAGILETPKCKC